MLTLDCEEIPASPEVAVSVVVAFDMPLCVQFLSQKKWGPN